jgi:hypothetical protein
VCCDDHEHCCPKGYTCNVAEQTCDKPGLLSLPWVPKLPGLPLHRGLPQASAPSVHPVKNMCDPHTSCPKDTTCCFVKKAGKWGCCPLPKVRSLLWVLYLWQPRQPFQNIIIYDEQGNWKLSLFYITENYHIVEVLKIVFGVTHSSLLLVERTAQYITGAKLPAIQDLYTRGKEESSKTSQTPVTQVMTCFLCYLRPKCSLTAFTTKP